MTVLRTRAEGYRQDPLLGGVPIAIGRGGFQKLKSKKT